MAPTVVFVTGVGRGIGKALTAAYLSRPDHVVIGSVRDAKGSQAEDVKKLPAAHGSQLLLVSIENASHEDPKKAVAEIEAAGIDHIDIVVSSSGVSPQNAPLDAADPKIILDAFNVNALSSIVLFQAVNPLLLKSSAPKWISVSSRAGSIDTAEGWYYWIGAYGVSKAAQNWFTKTLHVGNPNLTSVAIHPGFVYTDMGVTAAKAAGIDLPATSAEESASKIIELIDSAKKETVSGKFIDVITGDEMPW